MLFNTTRKYFSCCISQKTAVDQWHYRFWPLRNNNYSQISIQAYTMSWECYSQSWYESLKLCYFKKFSTAASALCGYYFCKSPGQLGGKRKLAEKKKKQTKNNCAGLVSAPLAITFWKKKMAWPSIEAKSFDQFPVFNCYCHVLCPFSFFFL